MTDRQTGSVGVSADLANTGVVLNRQIGSVGVNVDLANAGIVENRQTGMVGVNVDLANAGIVENRQTGSVGVNADLANVGIAFSTQTGMVGVNVDLAAVAIILNRETGGVGAQADFRNPGPNYRQTGGVGAQADFQNPGPGYRQTDGVAVQVDFATPPAGAGRETGWVGAQVDIGRTGTPYRESVWVGTQVDLSRTSVVAGRRTGWVGAQLDVRGTAVATRRTGWVAAQLDLRVITPRVVPVTAYFNIRRQRSVPANVALAGVGGAVQGFTGRVGTAQSQAGRIELGDPSTGFMPPPQPTRVVHISAAFSTRSSRPVVANMLLGGPGLTSAVGLPWSSLTQYERVGLGANARSRIVPISAAFSSISVLRATQTVVEVLTKANPNLRTTSAALEALTRANPNLATTQAAVELLTRIILTQSRSVPMAVHFSVTGTRTVPFMAALTLRPGWVASFAVFTENTSDLGVRPTRLGAGFVLGVSGGIGPSRRERSVPVLAALAYTTTHAVVTQAALDVLLKAASARVTQAAIEALIQAALARVTQAAVEAVHQGNSARVSQAAIEVLWPRIAPRQVPATAALSITQARQVPASAQFNLAFARGVPISMALRGTYDRPVHALVQFQGRLSRTVPINLVTTLHFQRTVPLSASFQGASLRTVPFFRSMSWTRTRIVPIHAAFSSVTSTISITQPATGALWLAPSFTVAGTSNGSTTSYVHYTLTDLTTGAVGGGGSNATINADGSWSGSQSVGFAPSWNAGDQARLDVELRASDGTVLATASITGHLGFTYTRAVPISAVFSSARQHIDRWVPITARFRKHRDLLIPNVSAVLNPPLTRTVPISASFLEYKRTVPISANFFRTECYINHPQAVLRYVGWAIPTTVELSSPTLIIKPVQAVLGEGEPHDERIGYTYVPGTSGGGIAGAIYDDGWIPVWWQYYWAGAPQRISCNVISTAGTAQRYAFNWIAWGNNTYNQLAYTATNMVVQSPVNIEARRRYHRLYPGQDFALGMSQGTLYEWGTNNFGQRSENVISDGFLEPRTVFTYADPPPPQGQSDPYIGLPPIQQAGVGQSNCVAMDVNGGVWTWGRSDMNQTGWGAAVPGPMGSGQVDTQYAWSPAAGGVNTSGQGTRTDSSTWPNPSPSGQTVRIAGTYHTDISGPNQLWVNVGTTTYPLLSGTAGGTVSGGNTGAVDVPGDYPYDLTVALPSGTADFSFYVVNFAPAGNASISGTIVCDPDKVPATPVLYPDCKTIPVTGQTVPTNIYSQPYAKQITSLAPARFVTCCEQATVVLCQDNTLWVAGVLGTPGPLPPTDNTGRPYTPVNEIGFSQIPHSIGERIMRVRGGRFHIALVTESGALWMVGANDQGQLGTGDTADRTAPVMVASNVADAAPFADSTMVMYTDGSVACCGDNSDGQCGQEVMGGAFSSLLPVAVPPVEAISYGCLSHTAMVVLQQSTNPDIGDAESEVWGWGRNNMYQLQTGGTDSSATPAKVTDQMGITQIALTADAVYATDENYKDATMTLEHWRSWGRWDTGALGAGRAFHQYQAALPPPPPAPDVDPSDPAYIAWQNAQWAAVHTEPGPQMVGNSEKFAGFYVIRGRVDGATALDRLGRVHAWGKDDHGQMGTGAESTIYSPYWKVGGWSPIPVPNIISAWMGWAWGNSNFVRIFEGNIMGWGDNSQYQLGLGHNQGDVWLGNQSITIPTSIPSLYQADIQKMIGTATLSLALLYDGRVLVAGTDIYGFAGPAGTVYQEFTLLGSGS